MKKKSIITILIFVLVFVMAVPASFAATQGEIQDELEDVQNDRNDVSKRLTEVKKKIDSLNKSIEAVNKDIAESNRKIAETEKLIADKQKEMEEQEANLNGRLRVMYKNGSVGFIDVILGSNSVAELISNVELVQKLYENDMDVMEKLSEEAKVLTEAKAKLETEKKNLASKKATLDADKKEQDKLKAELEREEDKLIEDANRLYQELQQIIDPNSPVVADKWVWPTPSSRYITYYYGWRMHPVYNKEKFHTGIDIGASSGAKIVACGNGTVTKATWYGGYGNCVIIDHGGGITTLYGHMSSISVKKGQKVTAGQQIGKVGSTGVSSGPHLHLEFIKNGQTVDPLNYVK